MKRPGTCSPPGPEPALQPDYSWQQTHSSHEVNGPSSSCQIQWLSSPTKETDKPELGERICWHCQILYWPLASPVQSFEAGIPLELATDFCHQCLANKSTCDFSTAKTPRSSVCNTPIIWDAWQLCCCSWGRGNQSGRGSTEEGCACSLHWLLKALLWCRSQRSSSSSVTTDGYEPWLSEHGEEGQTKAMGGGRPPSSVLLCFEINGSFATHNNLLLPHTQSCNAFWGSSTVKELFEMANGSRAETAWRQHGRCQISFFKKKDSGHVTVLHPDPPVLIHKSRLFLSTEHEQFCSWTWLHSFAWIL